MSAETKSDMHNDTARRLSRSRGTTSFTRMMVMASADEENFPHVDRELDPDSDDRYDSETHPSSPCTSNLDAIHEDDEVSNNGLADIVGYEAPKYCHDPNFAGHPECHNRQISDTHVFRVVDAAEKLRLRFAATHDGGDSIKHYRDWRRLKWEYGETMVHGQSSLRTEVLTEDKEEVDVHTHERSSWDADHVQTLTTTHEDFVEHYLLRQRALRKQAAHAKRSHVDAGQDLLSAGTITDGPGLLETIALEGDELSVAPLTGSMAIEICHHSVSTLIARRFCDEMSLCNSVSSEPTLVTTKPSYDSAWSSYTRTTNLLDAKAKITSSAAFNDQGAVTLLHRSSPAPELCDETTEPQPQDTVEPNTHKTVFTEDQTTGFPMRAEVQILDDGCRIEDVRQSLDKHDTQDLYSTLFNNLHPKNRCRRWNRETKNLIKKRLTLRRS